MGERYPTYRKVLAFGFLAAFGVWILISLAERNKGRNPHEGTIDSVCNVTFYSKICLATLEGLAGLPRVDLYDFVLAHTVEALSGARKARERASNATEDCRYMLDLAITGLDKAFRQINRTNAGLLWEETPELNVKFSAVISYLGICPEENAENLFNEGSITRLPTIINITRTLADNAMAILSNLPKIAKELNSTTTRGADSTSRRLLSVPAEELASPAWLSMTQDRRIMEAGATGGSHGLEEGAIKPDIVVAKDGTGNVSTIRDAVRALMEDGNVHGRQGVIYIKAGVYEESITITQDNVTMYGEGPEKTIIVANKSREEGITTNTVKASFVVFGRSFIAHSIGFRSIGGSTNSEVVALHVFGDRAVFLNCRIEGFQKTLHAASSRQFYRRCTISGTKDIIFGGAAAVFQKCDIILRKPLQNEPNIITAQERWTKFQTTGFIIQDCKIMADKELFPLRLKIQSYLARPVNHFSRTVIMESFLGDLISGRIWGSRYPSYEAVLAEYANYGPGVRREARQPREPWKMITDRTEALEYTAAAFIQGNTWLHNAGVPFILGLKETR